MRNIILIIFLVGMAACANVRDDIERTTCVGDERKSKIYEDVKNASQRATSEAKYLFPKQADYNIKHAIGNDAENRRIYDEGTKAESAKQSELEDKYIKEVAMANGITSDCLQSIVFEFHQEEAKSLGLPYK